MNFLRKYNKIKTNGETYFMGVNTRNGFVGKERELFSEDTLQRVYIIKGAPGSGKSRFMMYVADEAEKRGRAVVRYLCGSDHRSLDGIVIDGLVAICDGTSPHTIDMKYPGASSEIIDMSAFWNAEILKTDKSDIQRLSYLKSESYDRAYRYLRAVYRLSEEQKNDIASCCDTKKMKKAADKLTSSFKSSSSDEQKAVFTRSIGMTGMNRLDVLEQAADKIFAVNDVYGASAVFMNILSETLIKAGVPHIISEDPVSCGEIGEIFIKNEKLLITTDETDSPIKQINMSRFVDTVKLSKLRGALRLNKKCEGEILMEALSSFSKASEYHFELEGIYGSAMNYPSLSEYTKDFTVSLLD